MLIQLYLPFLDPMLLKVVVIEKLQILTHAEKL